MMLYIVLLDCLLGIESRTARNYLSRAMLRMHSIMKRRPYFDTNDKLLSILEYNVNDLYILIILSRYKILDCKSVSTNDSG